MTLSIAGLSLMFRYAVADHDQVLSGRQPRQMMYKLQLSLRQDDLITLMMELEKKLYRILSP
jgi:hypothetical protein